MKKQFRAFVAINMNVQIKMINDPEYLKRLIDADRELLAKVLEYFENSYGDIYKNLLIEKIKESIGVSPNTQ